MRLPSGYKKLRPVLTHALVWLGFAVYEQLVMVVAGTGLSFTLPVIGLNYLLNASFFYANSNVLLPRLYARRWYGGYFLALLAALAGYAVLRTELALHLAPRLGSPVPAALTSYSQVWLASTYRASFFLFVSVGYWFARQAVLLERRKREHEHALRVAEKNLLEANLAFLKSQISPHFLFNSLNFLYAQVYPHSEPAAQGILLLADTMRYALHENIDGKVPLTQEVQHLRNYIAMNQLRFNHRLRIDFQVVGSLEFVLILPLVLITFVENCFKHGELADPANPLEIKLAVAAGRLTFSTHNKKRTGPKEPRPGIGLANTQARLALVYPARHHLTVADAPDFYTCHLTLEL